MRNKKGWIRIVEAFIALMIIAGVLLIFINKGYLGQKSEISERVYQVQISILREIQLDDGLRGEILGLATANVQDPGLSSYNPNFPELVSKRITERSPEYLECNAKICELDKVCPQPSETPVEKDVYAQAVAITANSETYEPRQLKLFCWTK